MTANQNNFYHIFYHPESQTYKYEMEESLFITAKLRMFAWDEDTTNGGVLQISAKKSLIIEETGQIIADGTGYSFGYGIGKGIRKNDFCSGGGYGIKGGGDGGLSYGNDELNVLHYGSPSGYDEEEGYERGGGIIELIAPEIINYGILSSNGFEKNGDREFGMIVGFGGSGGSIKIKCKLFTNKGIITAKGAKENNISDVDIGAGGYGRIAIYCEEYNNEGTILPLPYIKHMNFTNADFTRIADYKTQYEEADYKTQYKEAEINSNNDIIQCDQTNFYQIFNNSQSIHKYELESLFINSRLEISKWNEHNHEGGILQIYCCKTLIIKKTGKIIGDSVGYYYPFGIGKGQRKLETYGGGGYGSSGHSCKKALGGSSYGDEELSALNFGSPPGYMAPKDDDEFNFCQTILRGGGIIELIAPNIINYGIISCSGWNAEKQEDEKKEDVWGSGASGGSIKFKCKKFVNHGIVNAKGANGSDGMGGGGNGRIAVYCKEYVNDGSITPTPYICNRNIYDYDVDVMNGKFTEISVTGNGVKGGLHI
eukprot:489439_1